jgi:hypothetical protein
MSFVVNLSGQLLYTFPGTRLEVTRAMYYGHENEKKKKLASYTEIFVCIYCKKKSPVDLDCSDEIVNSETHLLRFAFPLFLDLNLDIFWNSESWKRR